MDRTVEPSSWEILTTQSVAHKPPVSASPGNLLEMQSPRPSIESAFSQDPQRFI